jgi:hypothetical protein
MGHKDKDNGQKAEVKIHPETGGVDTTAATFGTNNPEGQTEEKPAGEQGPPAETGEQTGEKPDEGTGEHQQGELPDALLKAGETEAETTGAPNAGAPEDTGENKPPAETENKPKAGATTPDDNKKDPPEEDLKNKGGATKMAAKQKLVLTKAGSLTIGKNKFTKGQTVTQEEVTPEVWAKMKKSKLFTGATEDEE